MVIVAIKCGGAMSVVWPITLLSGKMGSYGTCIVDLATDTCSPEYVVYIQFNAQGNRRRRLFIL